VPAPALGRAFAPVELLRGEAAYAVAPIVAVISAGGPSPASGIRTGLIIALLLAGVGLLAAVGIPALSGARPRTPDLEQWLEGEGQALPSPTTGTHLRPGVHDDTAEPLLPRRSGSH
jgi:hypothetical protein